MSSRITRSQKRKRQEQEQQEQAHSHLHLLTTTNPNDLYGESIQERINTNMLINSVFDTLKSAILKINERCTSGETKLNQGNFMYWIGGSRAWFEMYECYKTDFTKSITNQEKMSILPGNLDVFYVCNTIQQRDFIWNTIETVINGTENEHDLANNNNEGIENGNAGILD
jgi:hypothetical protein